MQTYGTTPETTPAPTSRAYLTALAADMPDGWSVHELGYNSYALMYATANGVYTLDTQDGSSACIDLWDTGYFFYGEGDDTTTQITDGTVSQCVHYAHTHAFLFDY